MGLSIQDLIAKKQKEMAAKKQRQNTLKPAAGKHAYRILPGAYGGMEGQFWHDFGAHFIKTPASADKPEAVYICTEKTFGKSCPVCDAIRKSIGVTDDDKMLEMLKKAHSAQRYLLNVLHLTGPEPKKVQVLEVGQGVFDSICELIQEYGDITDVDSGIDIVIKREGTGLDTSYSVLPAAKSQPFPKEVLANRIDLDEFVAQENPAGETKALTAVGGIIGILPPAGKPALPGSEARPKLTDMSDAEDGDYEPATPTRSGPADDELDGLDDLDDLLN